ncbi:hypothetical protein BDV12DRAFT_182974 [Aspergillus spectabilis]
MAQIPYRHDGKVALVTGSGPGIGSAMAIELGRCGAKVVVDYANSRKSADKLVEEIKALGTDAIALRANIRNVPEISKLMDKSVAHFGGLDIFCSNTGVVSFQNLRDVTERFDRDFSLNTRGQFFVARKAYCHLNTGWRKILMSSNTVKAPNVPQHAVHSGSKGAINSFVRVMAKYCGHKKITANAVAPDGTVTDMFRDVAQHYISNGDTYEQLKQVAARASPLTRNGYPVDMARAVCFLESDKVE